MRTCAVVLVLSGAMAAIGWVLMFCEYFPRLCEWLDAHMRFIVPAASAAAFAVFLFEKGGK